MTKYVFILKETQLGKIYGVFANPDSALKLLPEGTKIVQDRRSDLGNYSDRLVVIVAEGPNKEDYVLTSFKLRGKEY